MNASHATKFRHVENTRLAPASRVLTHLPVSIPSASSERPALAATSAHLTFVQESEVYRDAAAVVRALKTRRVTTDVAFSRYREDLLLSAGNVVATVKLWRVGSPAGSVVGIMPHPTAESV
uniref:Uncharacterized protein n=1 Tax=Peronospora matthiolae TaxID=2874970 RepID=A0AAV1T0N2_9STRA